MASQKINYLLRQRIKHSLELKDSTVPWLAEQTGISVGVLRSRMAGKTDFNISELGAIAYVLGQDPADLLLGQVIA